MLQKYYVLKLSEEYDNLEERMTRITRYGRRIKTTFITTMFVACIAIIIGMPFVSKKMFNNDVGYYCITIEGNHIGAANTEEEVNVALANARLQLCQELNDYIYMDYDVQINKESRAIAQRMSEDELESSIYSTLFDCIVDVETQLAYTVRIDDYTVSLASKEEVEELFEKLIQPYNRASEFTPVIMTDKSAEGTYTVAINKNEETTIQDTQIVASFFEDSEGTNGENKVTPDDIVSIGFAQDISVNAVYADKVELTSVQDAYDAITKEKESKTYYIVKEGDTLSQIAQSTGVSIESILSLNEGLKADSVVVPGDELVITVPTSDITVVTTKKLSYDEDYEAEPQYIDDNNNYRGTNYVLDAGTIGHRTVNATVTYENGKEVSRQITDQTITVESKPAKIAVGTLTQPDYVKPVATGKFSLGYGENDGVMHYGVDWSCNEGTSVVASKAGTVTRAGWYADYGYCVDIQHEDGTMTRYGHNSEVLVSVGQKVNQGEQIALSGNTGVSTGPHVHFEIWIDGRRVNPLDYVNKN